MLSPLRFVLRPIRHRYSREIDNRRFLCIMLPLQAVMLYDRNYRYENLP